MNNIDSNNRSNKQLGADDKEKIKVIMSMQSLPVEVVLNLLQARGKLKKIKRGN